MHKWMVVVFLLIANQAFTQLSVVLPQHDSLRKIIYEGSIDTKNNLFESFSNLENCDDDCHNNKYKTLIYLLELTRIDANLHDDYIRLLNIAVDFQYFSIQSPVFFTEGFIDMEEHYFKLGDKKALYKVYYTLADYYYTLNDFPNALEYGKRAFQVINQVTENDTIMTFRSVINLANTISLCFFNLSDRDSALWYNDKAFSMAEKQKDSIWIGLLSGNRGYYYLQSGDTTAGLALLEKDIELSQKFGLLNSALNSMEKKLKIVINQKKTSEASRLVSEMKALIGHPATDTNLLMNSYTAISEYYETNGDVKQALFYIKKKEVLVQLQSKAKQDERIILVNKYFDLRQFELKSRDEISAYSNALNRTKWGLGGSLLLILILIGFMIFYIKRNKLLQQIEIQNKRLVEAYDEIEEANKTILIKQNQVLEQSDQLVKVNGQLAELDNHRQNISSMIVHDLKNALYNIIGSSVGQPDRDRVEFINETAKRMLRMVLNILDLRKFDEAKLTLVRQTVNINTLIDQTLENLALSLRNKALKVEVTLSENFVLEIDKDLIRRTIENITINAILHSSGSEKIVFNIFECDKMMVFEVVNWGSNIPHDKQQYIFEPFTQAELSKGEVRSTGLGLAFCKMVIQLHEGEIGVVSHPNEPTRFWFTLPFEVSKQIPEGAGERTFEFANPVKLPDSISQNLPPQLKVLLQYDVYEMSKVLLVLKNFHPLPSDSQAILWKNELEKAVYHCNNERYQELVKALR